MNRGNTKVACYRQATLHNGAAAISETYLHSTPRIYICQLSDGVL
jgi:hypothetical protein